MGTKKCFKCKQVKPLSMFYRHQAMDDGHLGKCKTCTKKDVKANYRVNLEHYVAYEKRRLKSPERKAKALEYQRRRRSKYPGKTRANNAVSNALRDGRLVRQSCEVCGAKAQAHHDDYRRPLVVRWLCFKHHREHHGQVVH